MRTIDFAVKWWLDVLTNIHPYNQLELDKRLDKLQGFERQIDEIRSVIASKNNADTEEDEAKLKAMLFRINKEREMLLDEKDFLDTFCEYVKPERRTEMESLFTEFITKEMQKDKNKCVYLMTDEQGVARLSLGLFCLESHIRNDNTKLSPLPVGVEMWVTPTAVDVRFAGEDGATRIFDDRSFENLR